MRHSHGNASVLTYDAPTEILSGTIGHQHFYLRAYSGGGRGSVHPEQWDNSLRSHLANTKESASTRGGTLPAGWYRCEYVQHHRKYGECVQLHRTASSAAIFSPFSAHPIAHGRGDDFFIHGRGEHGSDGCIVPELKGQRLRINHAVKTCPGTVYVQVVGTAYMLPAERGLPPGGRIA